MTFEEWLETRSDEWGPDLDGHPVEIARIAWNAARQAQREEITQLREALQAMLTFGNGPWWSLTDLLPNTEEAVVIGTAMAALAHSGEVDGKPG